MWWLRRLTSLYSVWCISRSIKSEPGRACLLRGTNWVFKSEGYSLNSNLGRKAADIGQAQRCLNSQRSKPLDFQYQISGIQEKGCFKSDDQCGAQNICSNVLAHMRG
jgi:hypothetical protein